MQVKTFKIFVCFLFLTFAHNVFAQKVVIKGKVTDENTGEAIVGVNIVEINSNNRFINGTITDFDGHYSLKVSGKGATVKFSYMGYKTIIRKVEESNNINIKLPIESQQMEEVHIVARRVERAVEDGYGTVKKRDFTGSAVSVKMGDIKETAISSVDQMLQGRAAGVQTVANSGDPGAGFSVRIRGTTSLTAGNEPLYIVDGVPIISQQNQSGLSDHEFNPVGDIAPEDIESIDILKDASATAIYGSRAANGVVIIKTKRGNKGKTIVSFTSKFSMQSAPPSIPMLDGDSYKAMILEADQNRGDSKYTEEVQKNYRDDPTNPNYELYNNNTNWLNEIEKKGFSQQYNFAIRGGGENTKYSYSTDYTKQEGTIQTTKFERFTNRFNLDYKVSDKFNFGSGIAYTRSNTGKKDVSVSNISPIQLSAQVRSSAFPVYDQDEKGYSMPNYAIEHFIDEYDKRLANPAAFLREKISSNSSHRLTANAFGDLKLMDGLRIRTQVSADFSALRDEYFIPPDATGGLAGDRLKRYNRTATVDNEILKLSAENVINYSNIFAEKHSINATFVTSFETTNKSSYRVTGTNTASENLTTTSAAAEILGLSSGQYTAVLSSLIGRLNYIYNDKYLFTATVRRDGSSKFGKSARYALLPAFAVSWRLSSEPFMQQLNFIDNFKIRASWGQNGNGNIGNYKYISRYRGASSNHYLGTAGVESANIRLDNLKWETTTQKNIGVDISLWKDRISFTGDFFVKNTSDLLWLNNSLPTTSGHYQMWQNSGDVQNKGMELQADIRILDGKFKWRTNINFSTIRNKITKLPSGGQMEGAGIDGYRWRLIVGDPIGAIYGFKFKGVYPKDEDAVVRDPNGDIVYNVGGYNPEIEFNNAKIMKYGNHKLEGGDAIYEDLNHDGLIDDLDITMIGNANPDYYGGITNTFQYKNISLSVFFQYNVGNDIINITRKRTEEMYSLDNQSTATLRRWRKQGDITNIPKAAHLYKGKANSQASDRFVEDGSYWRLKSVTLTYRFDSEWLKKIRIAQAKVFYSAYNLYTWTKYLGQDPEISVRRETTDITLIGVDRSRTAFPMSHTIGLNLSF